MIWTVLGNVGYGLMLVAFVTRDILHLRSLLMTAQALIILYTFHAGIPTVLTWNVLFISINAVMVAQILRERRAVALPPELRRLHERHFAALSPNEFIRWWRQGQRDTLVDEELTRAGSRPEWLYFLLDGRVRITREQRTITELEAGYFIAEMSLLTGEPANADVFTIGSVDVMRWKTHELRNLRQKNPTLWTKIQSVLGHDVVEKIRRVESSTSGVN